MLDYKVYLDHFNLLKNIPSYFQESLIFLIQSFNDVFTLYLVTYNYMLIITKDILL